MTMSPVPVHACGGTGHTQGAAEPAQLDEHAHHHGASEHSTRPEATQGDDAHDTCECVGCGTPAVATTVPAFRWSVLVAEATESAPQWPADARASIARAAHSLPFSNGPPQG